MSPTIRALSKDRRKRSSTKLLEHARNEFSQGGEDGVLLALFGIIGTENKWCVEFGAWDGLHYSNTANLIRNHGWKAVLIEGDPKKAAEIRTNHPDPGQVIAACEMIGFEPGVDTIDDRLSATPLPRSFDLISIDVDGVDWHIWESIVHYHPRVVVIEFNPTIPNEVYFVQERNMGINEGCSLAALVELGKSKGYELCAVTNSNAIFVTDDDFPKLDIADNSLHAMRLDRPHYVWVGYNGKIYNTLQQPRWNGRHVPMQHDTLQFLSRFKFHGVDQGGPVTATNMPGLETADDILREIMDLRTKPGSSPELIDRRARAWQAARQYLDRHRSFA